jgi:ribosome-associated translation inhibitor RaiA
MNYGQVNAIDDIDAAVDKLERQILRHVQHPDARKAALAALYQARLTAVAAIAA